MKNIVLGQNTLHVTKSYTYIGHIIADNLCEDRMYFVPSRLK